MARYIDADLLLAEIEDNTPLNFTDSESEVQAQFDFQVFKHMVGYQPTADAVPRASYDALVAEREEQDEAIINALHYMKEIRVETAREIFSEIDQLIAAYLNSPHYSIGEIAYDIEELKKKYKEGETDA